MNLIVCLSNIIFIYLNLYKDTKTLRAPHKSPTADF